MAREETIKPATDNLAEADEQALVEARDAADELHGNLQVIDREYSDNLPYDRIRLETEARFYMAKSTEAMLEVGKRLILLKEHEAHGDYEASLEKLGIHPRTAQRIIKATIKFDRPKTTTLSFLGKSKLFELMSEEDEELDQLLDGGTIAGKTLDDIDRMSVRELKKALRLSKTKAQEEAETTERLIEQKDKKINALDRKLTKLGQRSLLWQDRAKELQIEITTVGADGLQAIARLDELRDIILNEQYDEDPSELELQAEAVVYYDIVNQLVAGVGNLMHACDEVFGGYKDQATPMLNFWDEQEGEA